ncbi:hypothetical protein GCM10022225_42160 [Plantactinospora mayteni]|uniref:Uncharacterized protein n=1 Tax=Plantactinospora mayteni TaxID=566021 RepID=A0ABQ4EUB3_9ACTN|nr:hypothetical protein [Plantactinospora mayteni]GIG98240.1 hypothetical protein Pma05_48130 [Plantactinospora mayteni]
MAGSAASGGSFSGSTDVAARHLSVLRRFTLRARRVEGHSLASDRERILVWAKGTGTLTFEPASGKAVARWDLPDEEAFDSLAARCRPFLLNRDPVYHGKVMNALGFFLQSAPDDLQQQHQTLRAGWRLLDLADLGTLGYESRASSVTGPLGELVTDKKLAYAWLYGDLVHADEATEDRVHGHDIDARFQAGVLLITNVAVKAIMTLSFLKQVRSEGFVGLEEEVLTERVVARPQRDLTITKFATAPVGTPTAAIEALLDRSATRADGDSAEVT